MTKVRLLHGKPLMVGGKVALSDDCCCGPPCLNVRCENIVPCSGCVPGSGQSFSGISELNDGLNNTYCLTKITDGFWAYDSTDSRLEWDAYVGLGCILFNGHVESNLSIRLQLISAVWELSLITTTPFVFYGATANPALVISNQNICGVGPQSNTIASGGTATILNPEILP